MGWFLLMRIHVCVLPVRASLWVTSIHSTCLDYGKAEKDILIEWIHRELCWSLGFFTFQETMKQRWYWHSCLSRGQEPPLQIVSPPDEGKGRTALDIISFAVENKSIGKASFQSSNTITGSITLILVWGGMVSATWYLWAFLCLIYFFPVQKVTTLNGLRLFTKHFLHTCSRFT